MTLYGILKAILGTFYVGIIVLKHFLRSLKQMYEYWPDWYSKLKRYSSSAEEYNYIYITHIYVVPPPGIRH